MGSVVSLQGFEDDMKLINKHDGWLFIKLLYSGVRASDSKSGYITQAIGSKELKFYSIDELIADWEPL